MAIILFAAISFFVVIFSSSIPGLLRCLIKLKLPFFCFINYYSYIYIFFLQVLQITVEFSSTKLFFKKVVNLTYLSSVWLNNKVNLTYFDELNESAVAIWMLIWNKVLFCDSKLVLQLSVSLVYGIVVVKSYYSIIVLLL